MLPILPDSEYLSSFQEHVEGLCGLASVIADPPTADEPEVKADEMMLRLEEKNVIRNRHACVPFLHAISRVILQIVWVQNGVRYLTPGDPLVPPFQAKLEKQLGEAESLYRRALAINPRFAPAMCGKGKVHAMQNRNHEAEEAFRASLELDPNDWQTLVNYGVLLVRQVGDSLNGVRLLDRAVMQAPNPVVEQAVKKLKVQVIQEGLRQESVLDKGVERTRWENR